MGGIVAYEVVKEMLQRGLRLPRLVIIGATTPPCERTGPKDGEPLIRHFDLGQMRELLREYGATPGPTAISMFVNHRINQLDEILNNDAHLAFFLPPVQADLAMIQEYPGTGRSSVLPVPLFYMGGEDEKLSKGALSDYYGTLIDLRKKLNSHGVSTRRTSARASCGLATSLSRRTQRSWCNPLWRN